MHVQEKISLWRRVGQLLGLVRPQPTKPIRNELVTNTRQDYKQQVAQRIKRLEQVINAANGNGNGQGDNGNGQGNGDQQGINDRSRARLVGASKAAVKATLFTEHPTSSKWALQALEAQRQGNAGEAWDAHRKAAMGHDMKAEELRDTAERQSKKLKPDYSPDEQTGLLEDAQAEQDAADLHRKAMTKSASAHLTMNRGSTLPTGLGFEWPSLEAVFNAEKQQDRVAAKRAKKASKIPDQDDAGDGDFDDSDSGMESDFAAADLEGDDLPNRTSLEQRVGSGSLQSGAPITDDDLNFGPPPTKSPKEMLEEAGLTLPDNKPSQWWSEDMADSNYALSQDNMAKLGLITRQPQPQGMSRTSLTAGQVQNCGVPSHLIVNNDRWAHMSMTQQQEALRKGYQPAYMVFNQNGYNLISNAKAAPTPDGGLDFAWPSLFDAGCPTVNQIGAVPVTNQAQGQGQARFPQHVIDSIRMTYGEAGVRALGASGPTPVANFGQGPVMVDAGPQVEGCMEGLAREGAESRQRHRQFYGF